MTISQFLTVREAARRAGVSSGTIYNLIRAGELLHTRVLGSIRIADADLDAYLAQQRGTVWQRVDRRGRPRRAELGAEPTEPDSL